MGALKGKLHDGLIWIRSSAFYNLKTNLGLGVAFEQSRGRGRRPVVCFGYGTPVIICRRAEKGRI